MPNPKEPITRRALLAKGAAIAASAISAPLLFHSAPAFALPKEKEHYTDAGTGTQVCRICRSFIPGTPPDALGECYILQGAINPKGHCDQWSPKTRTGTGFP